MNQESIKDKDCRLADLKNGEQGQVIEMNLESDTRKRLQSLGMLVGTPVRVLHRKRSGTMVILLRGNRFALGSEMTKGIMVSKIE